MVHGSCLPLNGLLHGGTHQVVSLLIPIGVLQLSYGLSTEYSKSPANAKSDNIDADRQIYAKYYVSQIMQLGEEGIRDAWSKASCPFHAQSILLSFQAECS